MKDHRTDIPDFKLLPTGATRALPGVAFAIALLFGLGFAAPLLAQSTADNRGVTFSASVDWKTSSIQINLTRVVSDSGRNLPAAAYFTEDALRQQLPDYIARALLPIQVDSLHTVADLVETDPGLYKRFQALADMLQPGFARYSQNLQSVTLPYTLDFYPTLASLFVTHSRPVPVPRTLEWVPTHTFTGVVIYAKGQLPVHGTSTAAALVPCLYPDIFDSDMQTVVRKLQMDPSYLKKWGAVAYTEGFGEKQFIDRIGLSPLRIVATGLFGETPTDPIISDEDAMRLLSTDHNRELLAQGRILIIYGAQ